MSYFIDNITLGYGEGKVLLKDFSLGVSSGELIALIGRNGVGKSTLLRSLAGVAPPMKGDILIEGKSIFSLKSWELAYKIAYVSTEAVNVAHLRVWDVVILGRTPYTNWVGRLSEEDKNIAIQALEDVGVIHLKDKTIDTLSDGERQRVMIARAIAQQTDVILLDEPSAFLDLPNRYQIVMLLRDIANRLDKTIIYSTHDLSTAIKLSDSVWIMSYKGLKCATPSKLSAAGEFDVLFENTPLKFDSKNGDVSM